MKSMCESFPRCKGRAISYKLPHDKIKIVCDICGGETVVHCQGSSHYPKWNWLKNDKRDSSMDSE